MKTLQQKGEGSIIWNVLVAGFSIGLTRSTAERDDWVRRATHPDVRYVSTGFVPYYEAKS
jgi:hypothetical protein